MIVARDRIGEDPKLLRWSDERYLGLVEAGIIPEGRGHELIDGTIFTDPQQGALRNGSFLRLQQALAPMFENGIVVGPTVVLFDDCVFDPEFAMLNFEALGARRLPIAADVRWIIEVAETSPRIDLGPKKPAYARAGVPEYWVVDAAKRGVWVFTDPADGAYRKEAFAAAGEPLTVPVVGAALDTGAIFPPA